MICVFFEHFIATALKYDNFVENTKVCNKINAGKRLTSKSMQKNDNLAAFRGAEHWRGGSHDYFMILLWSAN